MSLSAVQTIGENSTQPISGTVTANQGTNPWVDNLTQVGGASINLGQATVASSLPVVIASNNTGPVEIWDGTNLANILKSDGTAAGQNSQLIAGTFMEKSGLSVASVTSNDLLPSTDISNYKWMSLQITGTWTGTITFQGSNDNANWVSIDLFVAGSTNNTTTTATSNNIFDGPVKYRFIRIRVTTGGTGTVTGVAEFYTIPTTSVNQGASQSGTWTVGSNSATGSAVPANAFFIGGSTGGNLQGVNTDGNGNLDVNLQRFNGSTLSSPAGSNGDGNGDSTNINVNAENYVRNSSGWGRVKTPENLGDGTDSKAVLSELQYLYNGTTYDRTRSANSGANTTGTGVPGAGLLGFDGTNWQKLLIDSNKNLQVTINGGLNPSNTTLNTYEALISTATTTTVTSSTAYISSITITVDTGGAASTLTIQDRQGTPQILVNGLNTATAFTGPTIYNFQTPIKMTSGISIVTTSVTPATDSIWINYYQ